jgi:hypothetical protein
MVKKRSSIDEKLKVQVWIQPRMKTAKIALCLGHGESTIRRLRAKLKDMLPGASPSCYTGCPRSTTHAEDKRLKLYVEKFPSKTAKELIKEVKGF